MKNVMGVCCCATAMNPGESNAAAAIVTIQTFLI